MESQSPLQEKPIPWLELVETLYRRRWTIVGATVAGLLIGILIAATRPPVYEAEARILLTANAVPGPREDAMSNRQVNAELALLRSPALVRSVVETVDEGDAEVPEPPGPLARVRQSIGETLARFRGSDPATPVDRQIASLAKRIRAEPMDQSNIVGVAFSDANPQFAARFVNTLLERHVERISRLAVETEPRGFFEQQSALLAERWEKARAALAEFRQKEGLLESDVSELRQVITGLESDRISAETEVLELQAKVEYLEDEIQSHPAVTAQSTTTEDETVTFLESRILELEMERSEKLSRYTPTSTVIRELDRQIEQAEDLLETKQGETSSETTTTVNPAYQALEVELIQTKSRLEAAQVRHKALTSQLVLYRQKLLQGEGASGELTRLQNEVDAAQEAHQSYLRQQEAARFSTALDESGIVNVSIVDRAEVPIEPQDSKGRQTVALTTVLGLIFGLVITFIRAWIDPTVAGSAQASRLSGLPVLAEVPPQ